MTTFPHCSETTCFTAVTTENVRYTKRNEIFHVNVTFFFLLLLKYSILTRNLFDNISVPLYNNTAVYLNKRGNLKSKCSRYLVIITSPANLIKMTKSSCQIGSKIDNVWFILFVYIVYFILLDVIQQNHHLASIQDCIQITASKLKL